MARGIAISPGPGPEPEDELGLTSNGLLLPLVPPPALPASLPVLSRSRLARMLVTPTPAGDGSGLVSSPTEETTLSPSSPALVGPTSAAPPPPLAKSILKRRATHPDKQPDQANGSAHSGKDKDKSLWFEGKRIRFSSLGSPGGSRPPDLYDDGPGQATQPATGGGVWLDEDTRKQMALMGQGLGRRKRKDRDGEPEGEGPPAAMSSTSAAELELVGSLAKKINNFTRESQEVSSASTSPHNSIRNPSHTCPTLFFVVLCA